MSVKLTCSTIIERGDSYLLVQEGRGGRFNLPGGGLKGVETHWGAAERETREETGLDVAVSGLVGIYQCRKTRTGNNVTRVVFSAQQENGLIVASRSHPIVTYFCWQAVQDLSELGQLSNGTILTAIDNYRNNNCAGLDSLTLHPNAGQDAAPVLHPAAAMQPRFALLSADHE